MRNKLKSILLIDDDYATNFLHKLIIRDAACAEHVEVAVNAEKALAFLQSNVENKLIPDIIFVDVNMPGMSGWQFLQEYEKLDPSLKSKVVIIMPSASMHPEEDVQRAAQYKDLTGCRSKPLTDEMLQEIVMEHFPEQM